MSNRFRKRIDFVITISAAFSICVFLSYILPGPVLSLDNLHTPHSSQAAPDGNLSYSENSNIPEFYMRLSKEKGNFSIIEYPAIVQDRYNPAAYYQSFHKKEILRGYFFSHVLKKQLKIKNMLNIRIWPLENIFSRLEIKKIYFTFVMNFFPDIIDLYDINSIRNSNAKYIVLHKQIKDEIIAINSNAQFNNDFINGAGNQKIWEHFYRSSLHFKSYYQRYVGEPVYEDNLLVAYQIK